MNESGKKTPLSKREGRFGTFLGREVPPPPLHGLGAEWHGAMRVCIRRCVNSQPLSAMDSRILTGHTMNKCLGAIALLGATAQAAESAPAAGKVHKLSAKRSSARSVKNDRARVSKHLKNLLVRTTPFSYLLGRGSASRALLGAARRASRSTVSFSSLKTSVYSRESSACSATFFFCRAIGRPGTGPSFSPTPPDC